MLFNFVLYLAFLTFFNSSVTDESFVDETRVWRKYEISILVSMMSLFKVILVYRSSKVINRFRENKSRLQSKTEGTHQL